MKSKYRLEHLDCANCALKIENHLKKQPMVRDASINFATLTLTIDTTDIDTVKNEIRKIEPDINVVPVNHLDPITKAEPLHGMVIPKQILLALLSTILLLFLLIFEPPLHNHKLIFIEYLIAIPAYLLSGWSVLFAAFRTIRDKQWFNEHVLMTIATLGALAIHALEEAVGVMIFYQIGEFLQNLAINRSRRSIRALLEIRPEFAHLKTKDGIQKVSPENVLPGDTIIVKPGEKVPLDGIIQSGNSSINTSVLTGESTPRNVSTGDIILSGEINMSGMLIVQVTKPFSESSVVKILDMVENAAAKKTRTEQFMTRFARFYTPAVAGLATLVAIIPPILFHSEAVSIWVYRALVLLVISCPCALVVSIPLGYFGGIGCASRNGILIKGSNFIDALANVRSIVFDKTGTLTKGVFKVHKIMPSGNFTKLQILRYAALAESHSNHHIARSIVEAFNETGEKLDISLIQKQQEISGCGIEAIIGGKTIICGNDLLLHKNKIPHKQCSIEGTVVHVAVDSEYAGYITVGDQIKDEAKTAINKLRKENVTDIRMLTGDNEFAARTVSEQLQLDGYSAGLLPEDKVTRFEQIVAEKKHKGTIAFIGDGINDSPVLARADIGIAMGALGSEAAIETADVVLMTDHPLQVADAIRISKTTKRIVIQNILFALIIKLTFIGLGSIGLATLWEAVFADMGVALIAVLNSVRTLTFSGKRQ